MFLEDTPEWGLTGETQDLPLGLEEFLAHAQRRWQHLGEVHTEGEPEPDADDQLLPGQVRWKPAIRYSVVFRQSTADELQAYGLPESDYRKAYELLWPAGWRLKHLVPYAQGTSTYYTAVWKKSMQGEIQVYGQTYADYRVKYDYLQKLGWRLKILAPYRVVFDTGYVTRYTAVWQPGTTDEVQQHEVPYAVFRAQYDELWPQGWRLKSLSILYDGRPLYTTVWEQSAKPEMHVYGVSLSAYQAKHDELTSLGWRLKFLIPYEDYTVTKYAAVWTKGTLPETQVNDVSVETFRAHYTQLWPKGWRIKIIHPHRTWVKEPVAE